MIFMIILRVAKIVSRDVASAPVAGWATRARCCSDQGRGLEVETGFEPVYTDLQSVASPLGHSTRKHCSPLVLGETRSELTTGFEPATLTLAR